MIRGFLRNGTSIVLWPTKKHLAWEIMFFVYKNKSLLLTFVPRVACKIINLWTIQKNNNCLSKTKKNQKLRFDIALLGEQPSKVPKGWWEGGGLVLKVETALCQFLGEEIPRYKISPEGINWQKKPLVENRMV